MSDKVEGNKPDKMPNEAVANMPDDVPTDASNPQENMSKNEFINNKNSFNKKGISSSSTLFISNENLKTGETYTIYINGEKLETIKIENCTTTIGNVQTMGGRMKNFGNR